MDTVLLGVLALASLLLLIGIVSLVKRQTSRRRPPRRHDASRSLEARVEQLEEVTARLEDIVANLKQLQLASREDLEHLQLLRSGLPLAAAGAGLKTATRTRGGTLAAFSPQVEDLNATTDDVAQSLMSQLDRQPMTLAQVRDCAAQSGRQIAPLAPTSSEDWLLIALSAGSGNRWFVVPRLHIAMGQVRLSDYFELRNYNGIDPLRARDVTSLGGLEKTSAGWKVVSKGWIDAHQT